MNCTYTTKIKDFFDIYGKGFKAINCDNQYKIMENVLGEFWASYGKMPWNVAAHSVTSWNHNYTLNDPIWEIEGFYSSCAPKCYWCFQVEENDCWGRYYKLNTIPAMTPWFLVKGEYEYCLDTKELTAFLPEWIENGYVRYYKSYGLDPSLGNNNVIPIPPSMMWMLKKLVAQEYILLTWTQYEGIDQAYNTAFKNGIEQLKDRATKRPMRIVNPDND